MRRLTASWICSSPGRPDNRVGAYTLVHAYEDRDEAAVYGLCESVNWCYGNLAEFTLEWELPMLGEEEQRVVFPLLEPVIRGEVPVEHYQREDMIIVGTPGECLDKILRYESVGVDQLLCTCSSAISRTRRSCAAWSYSAPRRAWPLLMHLAS